MNVAFPTRYNSVAKTLHWLIAFAIIGLLIIGKYMHGLPNSDPDKFALYQSHKSLGLTVLVLSLVRIIWRLMHRVPALPQTMPMWQRLLAHATHIAMYVLMIAIPLSGWAMASSSPWGIPTLWFGLFEVPHLPGTQNLPNQEEVFNWYKGAHELLGNLMILLLLAHVGAALKHHFWNRDNILRRMLPFGGA